MESRRPETQVEIKMRRSESGGTSVSVEKKKMRNTTCTMPIAHPEIASNDEILLFHAQSGRFTHVCFVFLISPGIQYHLVLSSRWIRGEYRPEPPPRQTTPCYPVISPDEGPAGYPKTRKEFRFESISGERERQRRRKTRLNIFSGLNQNFMRSTTNQ